ncbi:MAG: hypothetical protein JWN36_2018 [Microbacteriaceae bacterium]|jgi:hypothetical protein|nr:hypothetical protein [Microbacteriaceae bacterium]
MRTISYGGESFTTSDDAADALLEFAAAAAMNDFAGVIHLPAIDADGATITADLVIGPSSELLVVPAHSGYDEPDTRVEVAALRARTVDLGLSRHSSRGVPLAAADADTTDYQSDLPDLG